MHAGFPSFTREMQHVFRLGAGNTNLPTQFEAIGGTVLASGMEILVKLGFGYVMRNSLLNKEQSKKALDFFNENFVFTDPNSSTGERYYQGKFLIRTRKPGDDMNVYLKFCDNPSELFVETPFGTCLNSLAVVSTEVLSEEEARRIEQDPDQVDLVIRFKDINSILGLIGREDVDIVGLLLENIVQLTGNVGHLFKLGAIAADIEMELNLTGEATKNKQH